MGMYNAEIYDNEEPPEGKEKRVELIISGDREGINHVDVEMITCTSDTCEFILGNVTDPSGDNNAITSCGAWSKDESWWWHGHKPKAGESVTIPFGVCIIIDIPCSEMPELQFLEVNGVLRAQDEITEEKCLRSHSIFVRAGILEIGTADECFESKFDIILLGDFDEHHWAFAGSAGSMNKALVVTGLLELYSCPREYTVSRLKADAPNEGAKKTILVD